jgi:hypothetical protein
MVSVLASSVIDCAFKHLSRQTKYYKNGFYCISAKYAALRSKKHDSKTGWLGIRIMCPGRATRGMLFQCASTIKIKLSMLL